MADRMFIPHGGTLEADVKNLYASVAIGATGAPTLSSTQSKGIKSIVRNSAGNYTVTLSDSYQALLGVHVMALDSTGADPTTSGSLWHVVSQAVSTSTPTIVLQAVEAAAGNTAADPHNGATLLIKIDLRNSTVS